MRVPVRVARTALAGLGIACLLPGIPVQGADDTYLQFDSPRVLDLSGALSENSRLKLAKRPMTIETVNQQTGSVVSVLERGDVSRGDPGVLGAMAPKKSEAQRIASSRGVAKRNGKTLTLKSAVGRPFRFLDWAKPATDDADADEEHYIYAGKLKGLGYHKVDVHFGHDAPGSFFVHPRSGKALFVHTESDLASLSGDRRRLLVMNSGLNPPFGLAVTVLADSGPVVRVHCLADSTARVIPAFRGWHAEPATGFDLTLVVRQAEGAEVYEIMPLRFILLNNEWRGLALDADRLANLTGLSCWQ